MLSRRVFCILSSERLPVLPQRISNRSMGSKPMSYAEQRLIGYSREDMFDIVADVAKYREFVPWCRGSRVQPGGKNSVMAELEIGFPPLSESYRSRVIHVRPSVVRSTYVDKDGLFEILDTTWRFGPGVEGNPRSCTLHYNLIFEFRSALHRRIAHVFFDKVVKTMVGAFLERAQQLHGAPSMPHSPPKILAYDS